MFSSATIFPVFRCGAAVIVYFAVLLAGFGASTALADPPTPHLCTGFNPIAQNWERIGVLLGDQSLDANCPDGYAYINHDYPTGMSRPGRKVAVRGVCCRMPDGLLTQEHSWALEACPADSVATGSRAAKQVTPGQAWDRVKIEWETTDQYMRCTKLNTARFRLGAPAETLTIGFHFGFNLNTINGAFTARSQIPIGLRYGADRAGRMTFESGGCIGFPWGSLLTKKISKHPARLCDFEFRPVEYIGAPGDPPAGTPVKMFPDCLYVTNLFNDDLLESRCVM